jgi:GTP-binding protein YchF
MKVGIVGLPNVGKTTIFNTLTRAHAASENYPFCTIEPNVGAVSVPDTRHQKLAALMQPERTIAAKVEFLDVAGLVEGSSHGEGCGNQFLNHIRETQAIAQVVRCFHDEDVAYQGTVIKPAKEIEVVSTELLLADLQSAEKALEKKNRDRKQADLLRRFQEALAKGTPLRELGLLAEELSFVKEFQFLTLKPVIFIANVGEGQSETEQGWVEEVNRTAAVMGAESVKICGKLERELAELSESEAAEFLKELGLQEEALPRFIRKCYGLLGLISFFTVENNIVQAWAIADGAMAPDAAGKIHSDMAEGFIKAEVVPLSDLENAGSMGEARAKGLLRIEGKDYVVQDGDVVRFRFA